MTKKNVVKLKQAIMIKKMLFTVVVSAFMMSCSSESGPSGTNEGSQAFPIIAKIDTHSQIGMKNADGDNMGDASGGIYGDTYFMLEGFKTEGGVGSVKTPDTNYTYTIRMAIPKSDITVGTHYFMNSVQPDNYFADLDIVTNSSAGENEETISGKIVVSSYDSVTKKIKGTFEFKTSNGVTATQTHAVSGSFEYILSL